MFDSQHNLIHIKIQYVYESVPREVLVMFNSIGKSNVEVVIERVEPKCRVSRSPGSFDWGGERSALSLFAQGTFLMSFSFLAYCTASNKM